MTSQSQCGLVSEQGAVALEGVRVEARLSGSCVEVCVTQRYRNQETQPIEAVYIFPLDQAAAVCGFAAKIGDRLVRGKVLEREQAFAAYDDAMHAGDGAFLLDQERPNVFTASVGNLRPGQSVELQIRYVALAAREGSALRLAIPTTVSPRYVPAQRGELGQPDGERVNPEHWAKVPYGLNLSVEIAGGDLRRIESPSHPIRTSMETARTLVELAQDEAALDRDFVLLVERRDAFTPHAQVAREADGRRIMLLNFMPESIAASDAGHEVLFLLDCSGSMQGDSIAQAKRALSLCIRALSEKDTFNVVCFGSTHRLLWEKPRHFDQAALDEATRHVAAIAADLGGTEILAPLSALLEAPHQAERARRVLVLTDGQVSNEAQVITLAQKHSQKSRIFAFGIGAGASEHLVRGMARASRGAAEMIFPGERVEPKVLRTFSRVRTPSLDDVRIDWHGLSVEQAPRTTPPVFVDDVLTVLARVDAGSTGHVELIAGAQRFRVAVDLEHAQAEGPIPLLWARECIRELEERGEGTGGSQQRRPEREDRQQKRLIELGKHYGLLSSATSYVAIEERDAAERTTEAAELRRIPVALTHGMRAAVSPRMLQAPAAVFAGIASPAPLASRELRMAAPTAAAPFAAAPSAKGGAGFMARARRFLVGDEEISEAALPPRMPTAAPAAPASASDRVFDLLMTQRADGSFPSSPMLETWLGSARSKAVKEACAGRDERLVLTSLVIALLARDAPERESEWRPAVDKAKAFCAQFSERFDAGALL